MQADFEFQAKQFVIIQLKQAWSPSKLDFNSIIYLVSYYRTQKVIILNKRLTSQFKLK